MNGFVHIIESPSPADLLDGRTEGRALGEALTLAGIPFSYSLVVNSETFQAALTARLALAYAKYRQPPVLHFSMHGDQDGIQLTDGTVLPWNDLRRQLQPLTTAMRGGLLICMSACHGLSGSRMAMELDDAPTFWALVGHHDSPTWADAAVAYIAFYHLLLFKGRDLGTCVRGMCEASGDTGFYAMNGADLKRGWQAKWPTVLRDAFAAFLLADPQELPASPRQGAG